MRCLRGRTTVIAERSPPIERRGHGQEPRRCRVGLWWLVSVLWLSIQGAIVLVLSYCKLVDQVRRSDIDGFRCRAGVAMPSPVACLNGRHRTPFSTLATSCRTNPQPRSGHLGTRQTSGVRSNLCRRTLGRHPASASTHQACAQMPDRQQSSAPPRRRPAPPAQMGSPRSRCACHISEPRHKARQQRPPLLAQIFGLRLLDLQVRLTSLHLSKRRQCLLDSRVRKQTVGDGRFWPISAANQFGAGTGG